MQRDRWAYQCVNFLHVDLNNNHLLTRKNVLFSAK